MFVSIESIEMGRRPFLAVFMTLEICVRFLFTFQRHHHGPSPPNECLSLRSLLLRYFFLPLVAGPRQLQSTATGRTLSIHSRYLSDSRAPDV